MKSWT